MVPDTIYAPASAIGGAIAVIRVSGAQAGKVASIATADLLGRPRMLLHTAIKDGEETVDDSMAVFMPAPGTYTGEDMVELHCHGGMQTVRRVLGLLASLGFRPAEGGEFTKRAFLNGKMDLSQAEAVMDIITASAEQSLKAAVSQLSGGVSRKIHAVESLLLDALSGIDAAVDYPEEAEDDTIEALPVQLKQSKDAIAALLQEGRRNRVLRDGVRVVIMGRPNVGKSSLLNAIVGEDRAIVTSVAGTTRDTLDARVSIQGIPVWLTDTAGIRDTDDLVERIGVERAQRAYEVADVVLLVLDASMPLTEEDDRLLKETKDACRVIVANKADLLGKAIFPDAVKPVSVSAASGEGMDVLLSKLAMLISPERADAGAITNERHLHALEWALRFLEDAMHAEELTLVATDIREALHCLGEITGTDVDDTIIDRIFSRFCVGK